MADMNEVLVDWEAIGTPGGLSVLYFNPSATVESSRSELATALGGVNTELAATTKWSVRTTGRVIESTTGALTGFWNDSQPYTGTGSGIGKAVSNAAQALVQWRSVVIMNGRLVQGRTYLPGLSDYSLLNGQVIDAARFKIEDSFDTAYVAAAEPVIWHRPGPNGPGLAVPVAAATVWREMAVLRRRR